MTADTPDIFGEVASLTSQINALCAARASALLAAGRAQVDQRLTGRKLETLSVGRTRNLTKKIAVEIAPEAFTARVTTARAGRWVVVRPSREDGMAVLSAHLPMERPRPASVPWTERSSSSGADPSRSPGPIRSWWPTRWSSGSPGRPAPRP